MYPDSLQKEPTELEAKTKRIWVLPYSDQKMDFWEKVAVQYGDYIRSVYFPIEAGVSASGRPPQAEIHMQEFLRQAPLAKSVLVNPIVLPRPAEKVAPTVIETLKRLRGDFDVTSVTVTNLSLARLIKIALPDYHVGASTLMGIATPAQVMMAKDYLDFLVPNNLLLRDLPALERLHRTYKGELRLIVNEACLPGCPYRTQHFYEMAYSPDYPESLCGDLLSAYPWLRLTGAWVLPRHLHYYDGLYDSLKLAGRGTLREPSHYFQVLDAYIFGKDILPRDIGGGPASILDAISVPDDLFEKILHCDKNCLDCRICRDYYEQVLASLQSARTKP
jgi:collagenase-like PrtC family protease